MPENKVAPRYQKKQATAQQAEAVVDALLKVFDQPLFDWERPRVMVDTWEHGRTVFVWEEGPHGWMWVFPCGGMLNGSRWEIPEAELPKGVRVEPNDGCVVSVYQEVAERQAYTHNTTAHKQDLREVIGSAPRELTRIGHPGSDQLPSQFLMGLPPTS